VPHDPPQPSSPHDLAMQLGAHAHWPLALQAVFPEHVPQEPPQPSSPHCRPPQLGKHTH
jgi:hypothetical protein